MSAASRTTRKTRKDTPQRGKTLAWGLATFAFIGMLVAFAVTATSGVPGRDYSKLYVEVPAIGSLRAHDKVSIGGVRVGQVKVVENTVNGARITLQINPGVSVPKDSSVRLRANGLLGARYVQLIPGSAKDPLSDGATIKAPASALTFGVPDALDVFDKDTRGALGIAVRGLGEGMTANGAELNRGVDAAADATDPFRAIMQAVSGRGDAAETIVADLSSATQPLAAHRDELAAQIAPFEQGIRPFVDRREPARATLAEAPGALAATDDGLTRGVRLLASTRALAVSAHDVLPGVPQGLREASALLRDARAGETSPLEKTASLLGAAEQAAPGLVRTTDALKPVLPRLDGTFKPGTPILNTVGPFGCDIINFGIVVRSMTGFEGTGTGPGGPAMQFRLQAVGGAQALGIEEINGGYRDGLSAPCTYSPGGTYPTVPLVGASSPFANILGGRK